MRGRVHRNCGAGAVCLPGGSVSWATTKKRGRFENETNKKKNVSFLNSWNNQWENGELEANETVLVFTVEYETIAWSECELDLLTSPAFFYFLFFFFLVGQ